jgi:hypothetical protein
MAENSIRSGLSLKVLLVLFGIMILALAAHGFLRVGSLPDIQIKPAISFIGKKTPITIEVFEPRRGLVHIKVELVQSGKSVIVAEKSYPISSQFVFWGARTAKDALRVEIGRNAMPDLTGGTATIRVTADRAGTWLRHPGPVIDEVSMPVRFVPPTLQVTSSQTYVAQGGCEVVTYRVGESAVRDGVRAGSWWFPGYPIPGGGKQDRFALFAAPFDMIQADVKLVVEDAAGNQAERAFIDKFFPNAFNADNIPISDAFLNKVVPEIMSQSPELTDRGNVLDNYLAREERRADQVAGKPIQT